MESGAGQDVWQRAKQAGVRTDGRCSNETAAERIDRALDTLRAELVAMRQQDLQLLKQLIHISQSIRHLQRARFRTSQPPVPSRALPGAQTPARASTRLPADAKPEAALELLGPEGGLAAHTAAPHSLLTTPASDSGHDLEEEVDSLYGSATELDLDPPSPGTSPPASQSAGRSPATFPSLAFTQEELCDGDLSYGEILKRNVRLWKWSVGKERECVAWCRLPCAV